MSLPHAPPPDQKLRFTSGDEVLWFYCPDNSLREWKEQLSIRELARVEVGEIEREVFGR